MRSFVLTQREECDPGRLGVRNRGFFTPPPVSPSFSLFGGRAMEVREMQDGRVFWSFTLFGSSRRGEIWGVKERVKRALFIILGTYVTTLFALLPLLSAGAGLLKGFAVTTIIGISAGVFITRPAFGEIVKRILKD